MKIDLIPAVESDRNFFRNAHHLAYRAVIESMFGWNAEIQDKIANVEFNERDPHIIMLESIAVGVIGSQLTSDHLWFGPIYILPEYQNKKIGSLLVKQFIDKAAEKELPLRLRTLRKNEGAKKLYERLGFRVLSGTDIHWHMEYKKV